MRRQGASPARIDPGRAGVRLLGGGRFLTGRNIIGWQVTVNDPGDVVFNAVLDTGRQRRPCSRHRIVRLVTRVAAAGSSDGHRDTGVGTVANLVMGVLVIPPGPGFVPQLRGDDE